MCAVIGFFAAIPKNETPNGYIRRMDAANAAMRDVWKKSHERGRDGRGLYARLDTDSDWWMHDTSRYDGSQDYPFYAQHVCPSALIANLRAEPTTEYVSEKQESDQQPYRHGRWTIVHNGTIANDKELRTYGLPTSIDSAAIVETLALDEAARPGLMASEVFEKGISRLKGSYAILAMHDETESLFYACNYRPLWYVTIPDVGVLIASARDYLPQRYAPRMLPPYSMGAFTRAANGSVRVHVNERPKHSSASQPKALVVCSGGLDSVVAATFAKKVLGMEITLLNFQYGSRAEGPEIEAIRAVADNLGAELIMQPVNLYRKEDSPLLQADSKIAGGEEGAEFAHEWVPARNLMMLSMATALAEARGIETIVLGNNLEEAGAYPDNEPEFIAKFNDILPFAVGDGKRMEVIMPVGNLMKHEIVKLGLDLGAPLHLTWSCYKALKTKGYGNVERPRYIHCGKCGPCFMRRTAFKINNAPEVIDYAE